MSARPVRLPVLTSTAAMARVSRIATYGVLRVELIRASTRGTRSCRAIPYSSRDAMMRLISAVLATASSAIAAKTFGGKLTPLDSTTATGVAVDTTAAAGAGLVPSLPGQHGTSGPVAQLVSAPPCHGGGRGFESRRGRGQVAQSVRASA